MERRSFIQAALATVSTAGIAALGVANEKESGPTAVPRLPIGFLGVGHSHAAGKIKAVQESADWELIGVCEEDERLRAEFAKTGIPMLSREELFRRSQVVAVESLVQDHARHAKLALAAGKHVHLEKPPADTLDAFRELVTLAREKGVLLQMGYMWRYHPGINSALEAARQGWLGEVHLVRGTINTQLSAQQRAEVARFRGGTLLELGSHLIDVLVRLLGRATNITSILKTHGPFEDHLADNTLAVGDFNNDGHLDVFSGEGPLGGTGPDGKHRWFIWENVDGRGLTWKEHMILEGPECHEAVTGDVDGDGDLDICSKAWSGDLHIYLRNMLAERGGKALKPQASR